MVLIFHFTALSLPDEKVGIDKSKISDIFISKLLMSIFSNIKFLMNILKAKNCSIAFLNIPNEYFGIAELKVFFCSLLLQFFLTFKTDTYYNDLKINVNSCKQVVNVNKL